MSLAAGNNTWDTSRESFELDMESGEFVRSEIYHAIRACDPSATLAAIRSNGSDLKLRNSDFGSTYFHLVANTAMRATEMALVPVVYQLAMAGLDVNVEDFKGVTALDIAISRELRHILVALIRVGADLSRKDYRLELEKQNLQHREELLTLLVKYEPGLWEAVEQGSTPLAIILANSWCRINIARHGKTLIDLANQPGKPGDLRPALQDYLTTTEFVHATLAGDKARMLEFLMDSKPCDPHIMDISHQEHWTAPLVPLPLRKAAENLGHKHILHILPEAATTEDPDVKGHGINADTFNLSGRRTLQVLCQPDILPTEMTQPASNPSMPLDIIENDDNNGHSKQFKYEQSPFTGSISLRSQTRSRKSILDAYQVKDDTSSHSKRKLEYFAILPDRPRPGDVFEIGHIATPRGVKSADAEGSAFFTYDKSLRQHSARMSAREKVKARTKEIRSKLCVIS